MKSKQFTQASVLGAGVIGSSWAALFLAAGLQVDVYEPAAGGEQKARTYIKTAWSTLEQLNMVNDGASFDKLTFHTCAAKAVANAQFVQENVPERIEIKHALFAEIEPHLPTDAIVSSSASGLMVSEMQQGWQNPGRFILGHPFNPPHLIPLVELLANDNTEDGVLELAEHFYKQVHKVTIRVNREVPAHVANRLQAALWREAIYLVQSGVASVEDVDKAVWAGPGLRWAAMGPHMLFNLGAGEGGMSEFCNRYADSFHRWWDDLGDVELSPAVADQLAKGVEAEAGDKSLEQLWAERDAMIVGMLQKTMPLRD